MGVATSMADIWNDEDLEFADESDLVRQLRAVIKSGKKANEAYEQELTTLRPAVRATSVSSILTGLGVTNPKVAKLIPSDIEANEESIKAWVEEYGDVFGASTSGASSQTTTDVVTDTTSVPQETVDQWQRIQNQGSQQGASTPDTETAQLAQLQAAAKAANGNSDLYFAYLSGETPIPTS